MKDSTHWMIIWTLLGLITILHCTYRYIAPNRNTELTGLPR